MRTALVWLFVIAATGSVYAQDTKEKLDAYCRSAEAAGNFNGTVLIRQKGQTIVSRGYGYANNEEMIAGNENTRYQVGSVTKQFTATVILKLAEARKISLQDKLSKWYPKFPNADKVTIEQLLSHTSGIHSYTSDQKVFDSVRTLPVSEEYMIKLFASYPYDFEPGTKWSYSNSGYSLLGYIIQKVTGKTYEQNVREIIFQPLGMKSSGFDFKSAKGEKAIGYYKITTSGSEKAKQVDSSVSFSAGALYSTTSDLSLWDASLYSGKIISVASMKNAHTPRMNHYGLGWAVDTIFSKRVIEHGGGIDGFLCQNYVVPDEGIELIVLMNTGMTDPGKISKDLLAIMLGQEVAAPEKPKPIELSSEKLEEFTGEYEVAPGMVASFMVKDGKLQVDTHHDPIEALTPISENIFSFSSMDATLEFIRGNTGKVEKFIFRQGNSSREAKKIK